MKLSKLIALLLFVILFTKVNSQTLQIGNTQSCNGDTVMIPISLSQMDTIGAISLFIWYDTTSLKFVNLTNQASWANGTVFNNMHQGGGSTGPLLGKIAISWTSLNGAIIQGTTIYAYLKFKVIGNSSLLILQSGCEIADYNANIINVNFIDGGVSVVPPITITIQPQPSMIAEGESTMFSVSANNATGIQWQINMGSGWSNIQNNMIFSGATEDTLEISMANAVYNYSLFRAKLNNDCSSVISDSAMLYVITSINNPDSKNKPNLKVYPNPFGKYITIESTDKLLSIVDVNIITVNGTCVNKVLADTNNDKKINIQTGNLPKGEYLIEVTYKTNGNNKKVTYKTIKSF